MTPSQFKNSNRILPRWLRLALLSATPVVAIMAQEQLTPATLAAWSATGAVPVVAQDQSSIVLPAGGQLARTYPAGQLTVHLVSQPYFGTAAANWSVLEVGPVSLTFVRTAAGGGMVLLGDNALPLPSAIPLGSDYRSVQPLDLSLNYDNVLNQATLTLNATPYSVAATSSAAQLQVAVSSGSTAGWTLNTLAVSSTPGSPIPSLSSGAIPPNTSAVSPAQNGATNTTAPVGAGVAIDTATRNTALANAVYSAATGDTAGAEKALAAISHYPANTAGWELELAGNLVQVAYQLREDGSLASAGKIARLILQHLNNCVKVASVSESDFSGSAFELSGFVEDRFFGDLKSAETSYRQALAVSPGQTSAQSALDRLLDSRTAEQQKLAAWGHH